MSYYVTADWQRFVPEGDPESAFVVAPVDVDRLGLREALDAFLAEQSKPEPKQMPKPADKMLRAHSDK